MDKFSELKDALEWLEKTPYGGEWDSALVGGECGKNYHAVTNADDEVVRTADDSRHTSWLCDYLEAVQPSNIRALLAELEAKDKRIAELEEREKRVVALAGGNAELWEAMAARLEAVEAKLATPVRLMGEMLLHDWEHSVERQAAFQHRKIAWDARLEEDKKAIRAAGFTFTVEGDE